MSNTDSTKNTKAAIMAALRLGVSVWLYWDRTNDYYLTFDEANDTPIPQDVAVAIINDSADLQIRADGPFNYNYLKISRPCYWQKQRIEVVTDRLCSA